MANAGNWHWSIIICHGRSCQPRQLEWVLVVNPDNESGDQLSTPTTRVEFSCQPRQRHRTRCPDWQPISVCYSPYRRCDVSVSPFRPDTTDPPHIAELFYSSFLNTLNSICWHSHNRSSKLSKEPYVVNPDHHRTGSCCQHQTAIQITEETKISRRQSIDDKHR